MMDEAITTIQIRQNSINHWVLHSPLIVHKERTQSSWQFSGNSMFAAIRHLVQLKQPIFIASRPPKAELSASLESLP